MDKSVFDQFLKGRFYERLGYFEYRRKLFLFLSRGSQISTIFISVTVPIIIAIFGDEQKYITIILSGTLAIINSIQSTMKFEDALLTSRASKEDLNAEYVRYQARLGDYASHSDPEQLFVSRIEQIIERYNAAQQRRLQRHSDHNAAVDDKDHVASVT